MKNKTGPSADPLRTDDHSDTWSLRTTFCVLPVKKTFNPFKALPFELFKSVLQVKLYQTLCHS